MGSNSIYKNRCMSEESDKIFRSPISVLISRHCVLSGGIQVKLVGAVFCQVHLSISYFSKSFLNKLLLKVALSR